MTSAQTLVYFGDSLTDNGNLYDLGAGILPDEIRDGLAGPTGAVSDGPTHADYTEEVMDVDVANYAVAAAEAIGTQTLEDLVIESGLQGDLLVPVTDPALDVDINLGAQVDRFLADSAGQDLGQTTAFVLIGGNDFQALDFTSPTVIFDALAMIQSVIAAQIEAAMDLVAAGVDTIWLSEIPVAEFFAGFGAFSALEQTAAVLASDLFNADLAEAVAALQADGLDVRVAPTAAVTAAIAEDSSGFGLLAPYGETLTESDVLDSYDADQVAFYDTIHPSTATHGILGAYNALVLSGGLVAQGGGEADLLELSLGSDGEIVAFGFEDSDRIETTGGGRAIVFGGTGGDFLYGARGDDLLSGGADNDDIWARRGDDVLSGGLGDDTVRGMQGDDVIVDSLGSDLMCGGRGDDVFIFTEASLLGGTDNGTNVFVGGDGFDTLYLVLEAMSGDLSGLLDDLGIRIRSIEDVVILEGREALDDLVHTAAYEAADLWGLV